MKVWASASAIGLVAAYFAAGCSSEPPVDSGYMSPTAGSPSGGSSGASGAPTTAGNGSTAGDTGTAGAGTAGAGTAGMGGAGTAGGGGAGTAGSGTGGGSPGTCPAGVEGHCKAGENYPNYPGYKLALVEDFESPIDLNADKIWTWSDGSPQDGQTKFHEEAIKFAGGYLTITASQPAGCSPKTTNAACIPGYESHGEALAPNAKKQIDPMGVLSGEFRTKYNNYRYGRYEVKLAAPVANPASPGAVNKAGTAGNFLSTMFIFRTPKNMLWNEIDIELEPWTSNAIAGNVVSKNWGMPPPAQVGYPAGNASDFNIVSTAANFKIYDEHVYAFTWNPSEIEWFVDGQSIRKFQGTANVPIPTQSAKIMMNLWVFSGDTFGAGVNNKYPFTAKYDWFRFYKADAETTYPCAATPGCLPAEDKTSSSQNNPKEMMYGK
jgi:hypothetical protein